MGEIIPLPDDVLQEFTIIEDHEYQNDMTNLQSENTVNPRDHFNTDDVSSLGSDTSEHDNIEHNNNYQDIIDNTLLYTGTQDCEFYQPETSETQLSIESLMDMTPYIQGQDVVCIAARNLFTSRVKSEPCIRDIFFPDLKKDPYEYLVDSSWFDFETYAVLYICQVISRCDDPYNLHALIDGEKCDQHLNELPNFPEWKKVGFALYTTLFPDLVKDSETFTPFRAYLNSDREYWASELYNALRDSRWLYKLMQPIITGKVTEADYNRDINLLFVKLHLLDPTLVMPAFHHLQKALPNLNLEIATTNYLGGPLDWTLVKKEVEEVIYRPLYQRRVSKLSFESVDVYYGVELLEFIMREPKELELVTNNKPDNRRTTTFKDRCSIM